MPDGAVNTTYEFTATDVITSTKLNDILDQSFMTTTAIVGGTLEVASGKLKVRAQGITSNELSNGSVTTNAILDGTIIDADINASANILGSKLADNSTSGVKITDASITAPKLNGAQTGTAPIFGVRAWVRFNGNKNSSGSVDSSNTNRQILASGNVSSVLKNSTGDYTVTFTVAMPSSNYVACGQRTYESADGGTSMTIQGHPTVAQTSSAFRFYTMAYNASLTNSNDVQIMFIG